MRLRALVDHGILTTAPASDGSAYQEYVLTPKGRGLFPILVALRQWSEEFSGDAKGFSTLLVDRAKGRPVRKLELRADDGRLLASGDTELKSNPKVSRRASAFRPECSPRPRPARHPPGRIIGWRAPPLLGGKRVRRRPVLVKKPHPTPCIVATYPFRERNYRTHIATPMILWRVLFGPVQHHAI